jgi:hypothetical protein
MALTLAEITDPAEKLAFIARAVQRSRIASRGGLGTARAGRVAFETRPLVGGAGSAPVSVARKSHKPRKAGVALTASASPVSAPTVPQKVMVARPKAVKGALTVADLTDGERRRIELAFHESGHAVGGVALGGVIHSAVVAAGGWIGVQGLTTMAVMPLGERTAEIAFAGPWAEARWRAGRRPTQRDMWAVLDTTGCRDHREHLIGETGVAMRVEPLLERCWPAIVKVAQMLFRDGEIRHEHVCKALQIPTKDNGHHLALIRSGCTLGSFTVTPRNCG